MDEIPCIRMSADEQVAARARLRRIYAPETVSASAAALGAELQRYIQEAWDQPEPCLPWRPPAEMIARAQARMDQAPATMPTDLSTENIARQCGELARTFLTHCHRLHSPHYMGHQVPPPIPQAGLFDGLGAAANQPMAVYEMGPFAMAAERAVARQLGSYLGWREGEFDALGTHGGTLSNLTALLTARNVYYPESWTQGIAGASSSPPGRPAVIASSDSHYCIARAMGIMGLGTNQLVKAPMDARRRMDASRLPALLDEATRAGARVFALVASACTTPVGAIDPLEEMADFAQKQGLWLHVDGAHGASALLSPRYRGLVQGIERADSLTWDLHKMLYMPALVTLTFYKNKKHSYATFRQDAPYIFDLDAPGTADYDLGIRTLECTKRAITLGMWSVWCLYGPALFAELLELTFDLTRIFHDILADSDDFCPMHQPQCNILCFRHIPAALRTAPIEVLNRFQWELRRRLVESGSFYITSTRLDNSAVLRVTLMNPFTDIQHLRGLLDTLRQQGEKLLLERRF